MQKSKKELKGWKKRKSMEALVHMTSSMLDEPGLEIKRSRAIERPLRMPSPSSWTECLRRLASCVAWLLDRLLYGI